MCIRDRLDADEALAERQQVEIAARVGNEVAGHAVRIHQQLTAEPVSYTHLDVYKRQDAPVAGRAFGMPVVEAAGCGARLTVPFQCIALCADEPTANGSSAVTRACLLYTSRCV